MSAAKSAGKTLKVRQLRSGIGFDHRQKATLKALGLAKVGRTRELPDNPEVRAMVGRVSHLVAIVEDNDDQRTAR